MAAPSLVWQFVPDVARRRRTLWLLRFAVVVVAAASLLLGWRVGELAGVLVGLAATMLVVLVVESWGRSAPDVGPQRLWLDGGVLRFEGPEVYDRVGGEAFECDDDGDTNALVHLDVLDWIAVYPATTRSDGDAGRPTVDFHLVVDTCTSDRVRRCVVFDRRIPFRLAGERGLADAVASAAGDRWVTRPPDDPFGELDRRRLGDWEA